MFDALPISEVFIAKRIKFDPSEWILFDAYRLNKGLNMEINENGFISSSKYGQSLEIEANFLSSRRHNLKGVQVNCGLVVGLIN